MEEDKKFEEDNKDPGTDTAFVEKNSVKLLKEGKAPTVIIKDG
jgi:hypothetical protein